jgi:hypothetical protein
MKRYLLFILLLALTLPQTSFAQATKRIRQPATATPLCISANTAGVFTDRLCVGSNSFYGNTPFVFAYNSWNPSSTASVTTNGVSGSVQVANSEISSGVSSGTLTLTFSRIGYYLVTATVGHTHSNSYTTAYFLVTFGGTATRYGDSAATQWANGQDVIDSTERASSSFVVYVSSASQTLTFLPQYVSAGISNVVNHNAFASIIAQPI